MQGVDPLVLAAPAFLVFCGIEALVLARRESPGAYRLNDFVSGLGCTVLDQVVNFGVLALFLLFYVDLRAEWAPLRLALDSPWTWVVAVLTHDLAYYWFHRLSHRSNFFWAAHVVHHQGEDYNFTVSLRQGMVATWFTLPFYAPMALVGIPLETFVVVHGVYQIYQFFVHTELCPRLGPLEWIFATPWAHRAHHGRQRKYLDCNYGGFFIVWDRLFGTYVAPDETPEVGTRSGMKSWSPLWANFGTFVELARRARGERNFKEACFVWFGPPEGHIDKRDLPAEAEVPRFDARPPTRVLVYATAQFALTCAATLGMLFVARELEIPVLALASATIVLALVSVAGLFDGRAWVRAFEALRLLAWAPAAHLAFGSTHISLAAVGLALASAAWFWFASRSSPSD